MNSIGKDIGTVRRARGLSMEQVAARMIAARLKDERGKPLAVSSATVSRIESGGRLPHTRTLMALSAALGVHFIVHDGGIEVVEPE
jgi:transcriptional regulator with XRE-family HTH domain